MLDGRAHADAYLNGISCTFLKGGRDFGDVTFVMLQRLENHTICVGDSGQIVAARIRQALVPEWSTNHLLGLLQDADYHYDQMTP